MIHFKPFRFGRTEYIFLSIFIGLTALTIAAANIPVIANWYQHMNVVWTNWALKYGYWGAFLASFIGSITVIFIFPYTLIVFFLATRGLDLALLGVLMGLGAAIGQMSGYLIGLWGAGPFQRSRPEEYDAMERIVAYRPKLVLWLLFVFAVTPLPDDVLFIPLGMLRYPWWKVFLPTIAGKVITGFIVTYATLVFPHLFSLESSPTVGALVNQIVSYFTVLALLYLIFKLDWTRMMHRLLDGHPKSLPNESQQQTPNV